MVVAHTPLYRAETVLPPVLRPVPHPVDGRRLLLPGERGYDETLHAMRIGGAGVSYPQIGPQVYPGRMLGSSGGGGLTDAAAYWKLEDLTDSTANANTLTNNNSVTFTAGKLGNAATLSGGSSQYLSITDNAFVSGGAGDFTIRVWAKYTASANFNTILAKRTDGDEEYQLRIDSDNKPRWVVWNPSLVSATAAWSSTISVNNWHWILVDYDSTAGEIGITVDLGTRVTASLSGGMRNGTSPFTIGRTRTTDYFTGQIDSCGIWKRLWTGTEKTNDYNGGTGLDPF